MSGIASLLTWRVSKHIPWLMRIQVSSVLSEEHLEILHVPFANDEGDAL